MSLFIWATFVRKFVTKNVQKTPNLVTLFYTYIAAKATYYVSTYIPTYLPTYIPMHSGRHQSIREMQEEQQLQQQQQQHVVKIVPDKNLSKWDVSYTYIFILPEFQSFLSVTLTSSLLFMSLHYCYCFDRFQLTLKWPKRIKVPKSHTRAIESIIIFCSHVSSKLLPLFIRYFFKKMSFQYTVLGFEIY